MNYKPFDETFDYIRKNKEIVEKGGLIGIPYPFKQMNYELSGIQEGEVHMITAGTGVSKSKYTRYVYIYNVYSFHLRTGYNVKIFYFPLEDSERLIVLHLIVYRLYIEYGISIDIKELASKRGALDDRTFKLVQEAREYFGKLFTILHIYPEYSTPEAIFGMATRWAAQLGTVSYDKDNNVNGYKRKPNTPHTLFIIDNLSNVTPSNPRQTQHEAIGDLTREKVRKVMSKYFEFTTVLDAQQDLANDRSQFDNSGKLVLNKLMPTINGLATNKESSRDSHIMFGIFAPHRYGITEWPSKKKASDVPGYNIELMGNYFRQIQVLKNNEGEADFRIPLFFDGQVEIFEDLPSWTDTARLETVYARINKLRADKKNKQTLLFN